MENDLVPPWSTILAQSIGSLKDRYLSRFLVHQTSHGSATPNNDLMLWISGINPASNFGRGVGGGAVGLIEGAPPSGGVGAPGMGIEAGGEPPRGQQLSI